MIYYFIFLRPLDSHLTANVCYAIMRSPKVKKASGSPV